MFSMVTIGVTIGCASFAGAHPNKTMSWSIKDYIHLQYIGPVSPTSVKNAANMS